MTNPPAPETGAMLMVDCPFCEAPAIVDGINGALVCEPCAMTFPIDDEPDPMHLPIAA